MENIDYETLHKYTQQVFKSAGFVSQATNAVIAFTPTMKVTYLTLLYELFNSGGKLELSQQTIADTLGVDRKTINRTIQVFLEHGILYGEKRLNRDRGYTQWVYSEVMFPLDLEAGERSSKTLARQARRSISPSLRFEVLRRSKFCCSYCGKAAVDGYRLVIDHIKPVSKGGTNDIDNLTASCDDCNSGKGTADVDSYTPPVFP